MSHPERPLQRIVPSPFHVTLRELLHDLHKGVTAGLENLWGQVNDALTKLVMQETCLAAPGIDVCLRHQGKGQVIIRGRVHKVDGSHQAGEERFRF